MKNKNEGSKVGVINKERLRRWKPYLGRKEGHMEWVGVDWVMTDTWMSAIVLLLMWHADLIRWNNLMLLINFCPKCQTCKNNHRPHSFLSTLPSFLFPILNTAMLQIKRLYHISPCNSNMWHQHETFLVMENLSSY